MIKPANEFSKLAKDRYYGRGASVRGFPLVWGKIPFKVRHQELSIWSGYAGHGKSAFLSMMALQMAMHGEKTVICSFEMPADQTVMRMVRQALGTNSASEAEVDECLSWIGEYVYIYDHVGRVTSQGSMLDQFKEASTILGISQYQIDSLLKCGMAEDDYNGQKRLVEDLHNFAMEYNSHIHLVAHSRKGDDENKHPGKMDVAHSGSIAQLCNNGFSIWRNKQKEIDIAEGKAPKQPDYDCIVWCWKSRECGPDEEGKFGLYYNHGAIQYLEHKGDAPFIFQNYEMPF